jgi:cyclic pyranopterin phosphate synthase
MPEFSHFEDNEAIMVNIGEKSMTHRRTKALLFGGKFSARLARKAILLTHEFVPMAHPLPMSPLSAQFKSKKGSVEVEIYCDYKTGLELEALMTSAGFMVDSIPYLGFAAITHKEGGKSGTMERTAQVYQGDDDVFEKGVWYRVVGKGWLKSTEHGLEKVPDFDVEEGDIVLCSLR